MFLADAAKAKANGLSSVFRKIKNRIERNDFL